MIKLKIGLMTIVLLLFSCPLYSQQPAAIFVKGESPILNNPIQDKGVIWGTVTVQEDRENVSKNKVKLSVAVLKSRSSTGRAPAVFFLGGGPGGPTIDFIRFWLRHPLRQTHDIVLFDQRGSGYSQPRLCTSMGDTIFNILSADLSYDEEIKKRVSSADACRKSIIKRGINLSAYNSKESAADLDDVRKALGYSSIHLIGVSYGTRLAQTYMKLFPASVRSVTLDSSVPINGQYFNDNTNNFANALDILCSRCKANAACNKRFPDLKGTFLKTIGELEKNPMEVELEGKIPRSFVLNSQDMLILLQQALYQSKIIPLLPYIITEIHNGDKQLLSSLISNLTPQSLGIDFGTYFCVICNEIMPLNTKKEFLNRSAGRKGLEKGIAFYSAEFNICDNWPKTAIQTDEQQKLPENIRTLILSGELDPITPPKYGENIRNAIPDNSLLVIFPFKGHAMIFEKEVEDLVTAFIHTPSRGLDTNQFVNKTDYKFITSIHKSKGIYNMFNSVYSGRPWLYLSMFLFLIIIFTVNVFGIPIYWLWKKRMYGVIAVREIAPLVFSWLSAIIGVSFIIVLTVGINRAMTENDLILFIGLPGNWYPFVPLLCLLLLFTGILIYYGLTIFRHSLLTKIGRLSYCVLVFACIVQLLLINYWKIF